MPGGDDCRNARLSLSCGNMEISPEVFDELLPLAIQWVAENEARILCHGHGLQPEEQEDARLAGVESPEKIRILIVPEIPGPGEGALGLVNEEIGFVNERTGGLTLNYGIYIREDCAHDEGLYFHEFVHVGQYEKMGGISGFLPQYLKECVQLGYANSPLELEAVRLTKRFRTSN